MSHTPIDFETIKAVAFKNNENFDRGPERIENHDALMASLHAIDINSLTLEEKYAIFSYVRSDILYRAKRDDHLAWRTYPDLRDQPEMYSIDESLYPTEIDFLKKIVSFIDYSATLKQRIADLTETVFDKLLQTQEFRKDYLFWDHYSLDYRIAGGQCFLNYFFANANNRFPWETQAVCLYVSEDEHMKRKFGASIPPFHLIGGEVQPCIITDPDVVIKDSASEFFSRLHHEAVHILISQMEYHHLQPGTGVTEFSEDAAKRHIHSKYFGGYLSFMPSVYFEDAEEKICYGNQDRAWLKIRRLNPSLQLPAPAKAPALKL